MPFVNGKFVVPKVPFPLGTRVQFKLGPNARPEYRWTVFDHHGVTWEEGTDKARVVVIRPFTAEEIDNDPDPEWAAANGSEWVTTTWGRIMAWEKA